MGDWLDLSISPRPSQESYYFYNPHKIGVSTLENLGNTCYFNTVIQCLAHTMPLANYILTEKYKQQNKLFSEFARLVKTMWYGNYKLNPSTLYTCFSIIKKKTDHNQEDTHELLNFLLDHFHEGLKYEVQFKDLNSDPLVKLSLESLTNSKTMMSVINNIFLGQFHERLQCLGCRKTTHSFPTFTTLLVPIKSTDDYQYLYHIVAP